MTQTAHFRLQPIQLNLCKFIVIWLYRLRGTSLDQMDKFTN